MCAISILTTVNTEVFCFICYDSDMDSSLSLLTDKRLLNVSELKKLNEMVGSKPRPEEKWIRALSFSPFIAFVVDTQKNLLGFGRIETDGTVYSIYDMCVLPDEQGKAIGSTIIESLISQARQAGVKVIGLSAWTPAAEKFYLKHGFVNAITTLKMSNYMKINL